MKKFALICGMIVAMVYASSIVVSVRAASYTPPAYILYDSSGNVYPSGSGTPLGYPRPPAFTCYTIVTGSVVPCDFSGGGSGITALTGDVTASGTGSVAATVVGINGTNLAALATGFLFNTTATGVPTSIGSTGSGNVVLASNAVLVAPALGTPASGVITNLTGTCASCTAATATNLAGGTIGVLPYQSAANTTVLLAANITTTPQFLTSTGTGAAGLAPTLTGSTGTGSVVLSASAALTGTVTASSISFPNSLFLTASGVSVGFANSSWPAWSSTTTANFTKDTGIDRASAGVLEVNLGAAQGSGGQLKSASYQSGGTKFTTSGCSVSASTGGATAGVFTLGANTCTVVITMNGATGGPGGTAANGWTCDAHDRTTIADTIGGESSSTATTASIAIPVTVGATDVISFKCAAF